jgi:hypothetical protein
VAGVWCLTAARRLGVTFDEPTYLTYGLHRWRTGIIGGLMELGVMPLPVDVQTLPVYVWERFRGVPFDVTIGEGGLAADVRDISRVLFVARASNFTFLMLLLLSVWHLGRALGGPWAGVIAASFVTVEPSILAHASLATTDMALTASVVAFGASLHAGGSRTWGRRVGLPAIWCALAILSKVSGLVFVALVLVAVALIGGPAQAVQAQAARAPRVWDAFQILLLGLVGAFLYCGTDGEVHVGFVTWAAAQSGAWAPALRLAADSLTVFSNAGEAFAQQLRHQAGGHGAYLLGRTTDEAFWYYFPVLIFIKLSVPVLAGACAVLVLRSRALVSWPLVAAALIFVASTAFRIQTGIRLILPLVVLLIVGIAVAVSRLTARSSRGQLTGVVVAGLLVWTAVQSGRVWPNALCYTNELWGGTSRGYLLVSDSNYDWGQGLPELRRWQEWAAVTDLEVWYWGTDPAVHEGPWRVVALHGLDIRSEAEAFAGLRGRRLAVGASMLYGPPPPDVHSLADPRQASEAIRHLRAVLASRRPVDRTPTFFVFDFTAD